MSASVAQAKLLDSSRKFTTQWGAARDRWRDIASARIQLEVMDPMPSKLQSAMNAMAKINEIVQMAQRECS